jgi:hypothetical protein
MVSSAWAWPIAESFHFFGLCLLVGIVGLFDLRLLGFAKSISPSALHRLIPFAILGFAINIASGFTFLSGAPDQYLGGNLAFTLKMAFMGVAGLNVGVFYLTTFRKVRVLGPGDDAPLAARIIGGTSLALWITIITCGRLITFFRP